MGDDDDDDNSGDNDDDHVDRDDSVDGDDDDDDNEQTFSLTDCTYYSCFMYVLHCRLSNHRLTTSFEGPPLLYHISCRIMHSINQ